MGKDDAAIQGRRRDVKLEVHENDTAKTLTC